MSTSQHVLSEEDTTIANDSSTDALENSQDEDVMISEAEEEHHPEGPLPSHSKYDTKVDSDSEDLTAVVGDNAHVTINRYIYIVGGLRRRFDEKEEQLDRASQLVRENLKYEHQINEFFGGIAQKREGQSTELTSTTNGKNPEFKFEELRTEDEISLWYYNRLDEYERCYVQAVAVLHGASAHNIAKKAEKLYEELSSSIVQNNISPLLQSQQGQVQVEPVDLGGYTTSIPKRFTYHKPSKELHKNTQTILRRINGVERLFWFDVDAYGISDFGLRLLVFLAREFGNKGTHGQSFLALLEQWAKDGKDEDFWRTARALGAILWNQDTQRLRSQANEWAKVSYSSVAARRRVASLLDGAYEIDYMVSSKEVAENVTTSFILQLLREWVSHMQVQEGLKDSKTTVNLVCAAAKTYELIGQRSPTVAIQELEYLFERLQNKSSHETDEVFASGISTYVALTWSGHIRLVITHLAQKAALLMRQQKGSIKLRRDQYRYRKQREVRLNAICGAFFLVAATSLSGAQAHHDVHYSVTEQMLDPVAVPDPQGRDVILMALLSRREQEWRKNIVVLLCAAILEKKSAPAFDLIQQWAEIVLKVQDDQSKQVYQSFRQFLVDIAHQMRNWCLEIERQGLHAPVAVDGYKRRLEQWARRGGHLRTHPIQPLAEDVLHQISEIRS